MISRHRHGGSVRGSIAALLLALSATALGAQAPAGNLEPAVIGHSREDLEIQLPVERRRVNLQGTDVSDFKVLEDEGVREVPADAHEIDLKENQVVVRRLLEQAERIEISMADPTAGATQRWRLPYEILTVDAEGETFDLEAIVEVGGGGMRPQAGGGFLGRIFLSVRDAARPETPRPLDPPIEILVTAEVDRVEPSRLQIERTNAFSQVDLTAANPRDMVSVRLVPTFDREGSEIELPVLRGSLRLTVSPETIQGLGLEVARVTVRAAETPGSDGLPVTLSSDRGRLDTDILSVSGNRAASTSIRSVTTGLATVRAEAEGVVPGEASVRFVFPWLFLVAAVAGGITGAAIRRSRTDEAARRKLWLDLFALGVLVGILVATAYSVGINLLALEPAARAGEALVFVMAALGAFFGIPARTAAATEPEPEAPPGAGPQW